MDDKFWEEYQELLRQRVSQKAQKWYLRWVKSFDTALPDTP